MSVQRTCVVIPTYDNPATIRAVVEAARQHGYPIIVVDDGSGEAGQQAVQALSRDNLVEVVRRARNGGKGAAVKDGLLHAQAVGYTHAVQVDADGQHCLDDLPRLVAAAGAHPSSLVLGAPIFDASAPNLRRWARKLTSFWTRVEAGSDAIVDPMCGFRVYPVDAALFAGARGNYMDFDPEIAVRMVWGGVPVVNVPTRVRYVAREQGGVSHFRLFRDNALISWMHTRLVAERILRALSSGVRRLFA